MRLNRLDLTRYGKFTDHVIDFGPPTERGCDLHIVYGPNEAGKSTLFHGWLDLLYGIGAQSSYNFLHPYPTMQIGAAIAFEDKTIEVIRRKRSQNSLFDAQDQPISEGVLLAGLGGLDRDAYRTMFSLDDETLEQGGESILASRGDLGELLFSASAGLGELSQRLVQIRGETEDFYKYRARSGRLAALKSDLAGLKAERDRLDTQASDYARLTRIHDDATERHAEASSQRQQVRARLAAINRLLTALPRLGELDTLARQIEPLAGLPDAAPEWRDQIRKLSEDDAALQAGGAALHAEIERLTADLEAIGVDPGILSLQDRMTDLDRLRTRHNAAEEDLPDRRAALARLQGRIEHLLTQLGRPGEAEPDRLLLDTATSAGLRELIEARTSLDVRLATARREAEDARAAREELQAQLGDSGGKADDLAPDERPRRIAALASLVTTILGEDHGLRRQAARRAIPDAREKCDACLNALLPWQGDIAELEAMTPPSTESLRKWKGEGEDLERKLAAVIEETARLSTALRRHEAEAAAITQSRSLPSSEAADALRAARDEAWAHHTSKLDAQSALTFEAAMQAFDAATDKRASHQADVAKLNECAVQIAVLRADLEGAALARSRLESARTDLMGRIAASVTALSPALPNDMTPDALADWLARRDRALEAGRTVRDHCRQLESAEADRRAATDRLVRALAPLDAAAASDQDLETLIARAQDLISREAKLEAHRQQRAQQERALGKREQDLRTADEELQAWLLAWKGACAGCWIGQAGRTPTAAEIREVLPLLGELGSALHDRAGLADRIAKMEQDQADYAAALHEIAQQAGIDTHDDAVEAIARQLATRLTAADKARSQRADIAARIEDARMRQRVHAEQRDAHAKIRDPMLTALKAETLTDAALSVDRALERKALSARVDEIRQQICESLGVGNFDEACEQLTLADSAALSAEKQALEAALETLDADVQELYAARTNAASELAAVGGDDAVALIEQQRQTILVAIAEGAEHYLRLSAGILAMEQALTLYRERHRSSMMARASDAVRTISRGRYTGLASQPDKGRETLIALQNDGSSKQAADMSKGARFQLYLALRVAGFHEFAETRPPVPFIADDIMETFDDFRAEEAFKLFAGMAGAGQVIYLTHHRHLCDIASAVCPGVTIHELAP
ncbi:AAA family ATPase [Hoeflea sp.]|uniref:AAA family ATPase n=1 Tax=Hoeflea sp. TaxID=1940281 RepID=UPI0019A6A8E4|nr:AAA family ATPase [Hoeflea sp.]MBC7280687.1 AAA family ATPase [Hoeflea sp.]